MFGQILNEKRNEINTYSFPLGLPNPEEFILAGSQENLDRKYRKNNKYLTEIVWPEFLQDPGTVFKHNLYDFAEWAKGYIEKTYMIAEERRKIMKNMRTIIIELGQSHERLSKNLMKSLKNTLLSIDIDFLGKKTTNIYQSLVTLCENTVKKFNSYSNFINLKVTTLETIIYEFEKNTRISRSTLEKALNDHTQIRNGLLKLTNQKGKNH